MDRLYLKSSIKLLLVVGMGHIKYKPNPLIVTALKGISSHWCLDPFNMAYIEGNRNGKEIGSNF